MHFSRYLKVKEQMANEGAVPDSLPSDLEADLQVTYRFWCIVVCTGCTQNLALTPCCCP